MLPLHVQPIDQESKLPWVTMSRGHFFLAQFASSFLLIVAFLDQWLRTYFSVLEKTSKSAARFLKEDA